MLSSPYQQGTFCISLLKRATSDITKLITNADYFYDFEEAINAGLEEIGNQYEFVVFGFLKD
ncbi:putative phage associated protein [Neisseria meningitidis 96023]|nr:putative phage associated protein [Neisseria meningitidis 96023]